MANTFNEKLTTVLSQINGMTNSIILKYPQTVAVSESQDIMTLIDTSKLSDTEFKDIYLMDSLNEFLSLVKLFGSEATVTIDENNINIENDTSKSTYVMASKILMEAYDKDPVQFEKTEQAPSVATFDISVEDMKKIKEASGVFKDLSELIFTSKDGDMNIWLGATNKFNAKSHTYSVTKAAETSKEFEIKIDVDKFKLLPVSHYTIDIKYNSARDSYRILLTNKTIDGLKVLMSVKI